ncbi:hypothetical protein Q4T40_09310 [Selenomonadales bacterium 4137-cl]|uniref:Serine protease n=1 Tax=Anaeroselena agilis TaxID=3063788 RepID=A0ABU3NXA8_9FIRM|nr:hypothetical protein [Selenomonadales bacterium 4137-cl]
MKEIDWPALYRELVLIDNVVGVGRGIKMVRGESTGQEAVVVLVRKKYPRSDLARAALVPKRVAGAVSDVIEVGDIRLLGTERTGEHRPARPGISIGHYKVSAGTFGALVRDRATGESLILSNNHVLANLTNGADGRAEAGDAILQPALYDGGSRDTSVIGHLQRFVPLHSQAVPPLCRIARTFEALVNKFIGAFKPQYRVQVWRDNETPNMVDCAVAAPVAADAVAADVFEVGDVQGVRETEIGMPVKKSGRSSGLTSSIILATDVTLRVEMNYGEYGVFADQLLAGPMSLPGDSGSLVLSEDNFAVGLLFAGSEQATMFTPIQRVLDALEVAF